MVDPNELYQGRATRKKDLVEEYFRNHNHNHKFDQNTFAAFLASKGVAIDRSAGKAALKRALAKASETPPPIPIPDPLDSEPLFEEPVVQEPVVQEPVVQEPVVQEPVVQEPVVQEPVVQEPVVQEPVVQEPVVQEPVVQEPVVQEPVENASPAPQAQEVSGVPTKKYRRLRILFLLQALALLLAVYWITNSDSSEVVEVKQEIAQPTPDIVPPVVTAPVIIPPSSKEDATSQPPSAVVDGKVLSFAMIGEKKHDARLRNMFGQLRHQTAVRGYLLTPTEAAVVSSNPLAMNHLITEGFYKEESNPGLVLPAEELNTAAFFLGYASVQEMQGAIDIDQIAPATTQTTTKGREVQLRTLPFDKVATPRLCQAFREFNASAEKLEQTLFAGEGQRTPEAQEIMAEALAIAEGQS